MKKMFRLSALAAGVMMLAYGAVGSAGAVCTLPSNIQSLCNGSASCVITKSNCAALNSIDLQSLVEKCGSNSSDIKNLINKGSCNSDDIQKLVANGTCSADDLQCLIDKCGLLPDNSQCVANQGNSTGTTVTTPAATTPATTTPATTTPAVTTPTTPVATTPQTNNNAVSSVSDYEKKVVDLVNDIRTQNGLSALTLNTELSAVARTKSEDMRDKHYFDHTSPTYGTPFEMMKSFGISYRTAGENIAMGQQTPEAVVNAWMNSDGHRANILNSSFTQIGVGYAADGNYWTQMFIG